jgi:hypothetical protein
MDCPRDWIGLFVWFENKKEVFFFSRSLAGAAAIPCLVEVGLRRSGREKRRDEMRRD